MSIFVRPDSPPPRQPSPDITPSPLPYPHHPRRVASQPKIRLHSPSPSRPPGLSPSPLRTVQPARSYDHITKTHSDHDSLMSKPTRTRQPLTAFRSVPQLNRSTPRRRSSVHICPVSNPSLPPAPAALEVSSSLKPMLRPQTSSGESFYLPHIGEMRPNILPQRKPTSKPVLPPVEKNKSLSMACLRFFRFRHNHRSPSNTKHGSLSWQA